MRVLKVTMCEALRVHFPDFVFHRDSPSIQDMWRSTVIRKRVGVARLTYRGLYCILPTFKTLVFMKIYINLNLIFERFSNSLFVLIEVSHMKLPFTKTC